MTMVEPYFDWLCGISSVADNPYRSYRLLAKQLYFTEFVIEEEMDSNRASDGINLRKEFEQNTGILVDKQEPCSVFEMMIALAARMNYITLDEYGTDRTGSFFMIMLDNLGLTDRFSDDDFDSSCMDEVNDILEILNFRMYDYNGLGGLFPLDRPLEDQRKVEIWYQMQHWIDENLD